MWNGFSFWAHFSKDLIIVINLNYPFFEEMKISGQASQVLHHFTLPIIACQSFSNQETSIPTAHPFDVKSQRVGYREALHNCIPFNLLLAGNADSRKNQPFHLKGIIYLRCLFQHVELIIRKKINP
jgi:hypothetical protein